VELPWIVFDVLLNVQLPPPCDANVDDQPVRDVAHPVIVRLLFDIICKDPIASLPALFLTVSVKVPDVFRNKPCGAIAADPEIESVKFVTAVSPVAPVAVAVYAATNQSGKTNW
jgi:hypothetical protein